MGAGRLLFALWRPSAIRVRHSRLHNILGPYQASDCAAVATEALLVGGDSSVRLAPVYYGEVSEDKNGCKEKGRPCSFLFFT